MIGNSKKLDYIGAHKNAFEIEYLYPLDIFEKFVETTGDCLIECSCKLRKISFILLVLIFSFQTSNMFII